MTTQLDNDPHLNEAHHHQHRTAAATSPATTPPHAHTTGGFESRKGSSRWDLSCNMAWASKVLFNFLVYLRTYLQDYYLQLQQAATHLDHITPHNIQLHLDEHATCQNDTPTAPKKAQTTIVWASICTLRVLQQSFRSTMTDTTVTMPQHFQHPLLWISPHQQTNKYVWPIFGSSSRSSQGHFP